MMFGAAGRKAAGGGQELNYKGGQWPGLGGAWHLSCGCQGASER